MADTRRFKELEEENSQLKKMLANEMLMVRVLEETLEKSGKRRGRQCKRLSDKVYVW